MAELKTRPYGRREGFGGGGRVRFRGGEAGAELGLDGVEAVAELKTRPYGRREGFGGGGRVRFMGGEAGADVGLDGVEAVAELKTRPYGRREGFGGGGRVRFMGGEAGAELGLHGVEAVAELKTRPYGRREASVGAGLRFWHRVMAKPNHICQVLRAQRGDPPCTHARHAPCPREARVCGKSHARIRNAKPAKWPRKARKGL